MAAFVVNALRNVSNTMSSMTNAVNTLVGVLEPRVTELSDDDGDRRCYVALSSNHLDAQKVIDRVRSPQAGAIVLFAGTTRDNFDGKAVKELFYHAYEPRALQTMMDICQTMAKKHSLKSIAMIHRLGIVPIGEESILIAVSSPHRQAAWKAGEEALEECKRKVEVWKKEEFEGGEGVWKANRDGAKGEKVVDVKDDTNVNVPIERGDLGPGV